MSKIKWNYTENVIYVDSDNGATIKTDIKRRNKYVEYLVKKHNNNGKNFDIAKSVAAIHFCPSPIH